MLTSLCNTMVKGNRAACRSAETVPMSAVMSAGVGVAFQVGHVYCLRGPPYDIFSRRALKHQYHHLRGRGVGGFYGREARGQTSPDIAIIWRCKYQTWEICCLRSVFTVTNHSRFLVRFSHFRCINSKVFVFCLIVYYTARCRVHLLKCSALSDVSQPHQTPRPKP